MPATTLPTHPVKYLDCPACDATVTMRVAPDGARTCIACDQACGCTTYPQALTPCAAHAPTPDALHGRTDDESEERGEPTCSACGDRTPASHLRARRPGAVVCPSCYETVVERPPRADRGEFDYARGY